MIKFRNFMLLPLILLIVVGCTPRDDSLVYRPEKLEPPVERPIEADNECEGEDCPLPGDDTVIEDILVDNFDPYGSGEAENPTNESPTSLETIVDSQVESVVNNVEETVVDSESDQ